MLTRTPLVVEGKKTAASAPMGDDWYRRSKKKWRVYIKPKMGKMSSTKWIDVEAADQKSAINKAIIKGKKQRIYRDRFDDIDKVQLLGESLLDRVMEGGGYDDPADLPEFDKAVIAAVRKAFTSTSWRSDLSGHTIETIRKQMVKDGVQLPAANQAKKQIHNAIVRLSKRKLLWARMEYGRGRSSEKRHLRATAYSPTAIKQSGYTDLLIQKLRAAGIKSAAIAHDRAAPRVKMTIADVVKLASLPSFQLPTKDEARAHRHAKGA